VIGWLLVWRWGGGWWFAPSPTFFFKLMVVGMVLEGGGVG
jgi:hypothetical protein